MPQKDKVGAQTNKHPEYTPHEEDKQTQERHQEREKRVRLELPQATSKRWHMHAHNRASKKREKSEA